MTRQSATRTALIASLTRDFYDPYEWAQITAGKCVELVETGTVHGNKYCTRSAPDDHVLCKAHQRDFFSNFGRKPTPGGG